MTTKRRATVAALAVSGLALAGLGLAPAGLGLAPASAATSPVTTTAHRHGTFTLGDAYDFCTKESVIATVDGNSVFHTTLFPDTGAVHGSFNTTGTATFTQPSTGLEFTGHINAEGNFTPNNKNETDDFTATFKFTAVDASGVTHTEVGHLVEHLSFSASDPSAPNVEFSKLNATCS